ncbi:hypothetical protein AD006_30065 (plasmid) [Pseudonocardia sp. EC080610-09]|nr:hypothetical protein AD006_30065 [Pseudonocardia sp. EC080610-09]ALL85557.1 hypothetical protein AD017_31185 [Pseudonocardia sp. EC080619-01]
MRILAFAGVSASTVFSLASLLHAARHKGHEVLLAAGPDAAPWACKVGLPVTIVTPMTWQEAAYQQRDGSPWNPPEDSSGHREHVGFMFGRFAAATLAGLADLVQAWRPDVTVGGPLAFSAALVAAELGVPYVRQAWDAGDPAREEEVGGDQVLAPELGRLGLNEVPDPDLRVEIAPPSLLSPDLPPGTPMRWAPTNVQCPLDPWMYRRASNRPRVLVTAGSMASPEHRGEILRRMINAVVDMDAEVIVATRESMAEVLHDERRGVFAGWVPLDIVAPTCDVIVKPVGNVSLMTALRAGVPQVTLAEQYVLIGTTRSVADRGAGIMLPPGEDTPNHVVDACRKVLANPSFQTRAGELAAEMASLPPPSSVVADIERLART